MSRADSSAEPLLLFPCNGNALEALDCLGERYRAIGFVDDAADKRGRTVAGLPVYGRGALVEHPEARVLAVPGSPTSYQSRLEAIRGLGIDEQRFATVIHPRAVVSPFATIGRNVLIMAGVVVTSNAVIEDDVGILPNTVVHHDSVIGRGSLVGSNVTIAGRVTIGTQCYIGSGSRLMNGLTVGDGALIGLGSNVIRPVAPGARVAGNPARPL